MEKILLGVSSSFCANFLKGQVDFLNQQGFEVVIISGPGEEIGILAKREKAKLYTINFTRRFTLISDLICLWQIIKILKAEKPSLVNAGNPKSGFLIMLACWLIRLQPRIFTMHGLLSDTKKGLSRFIITLTEKICCNIAKKVMVVSPSLMEHAINRGILSKEKGLVLEKGSYNGISLEDFSRTNRVMEDARKIRRELALKPQDFIIGFVGRLNKDKGIDLLLDAFDSLSEKYDAVRLVLAGPLEKDDPVSIRARHQLYFDKKIFFLGKIFDVAPIYPLFDVLVVSSYREGFGNVLIEAAAMEVPVIAPDIPGCRDALSPNHNGFLYTRGNAVELAAAIERYILDPALKATHASAGRNFVEANFASARIWNAQLLCYRQLLSSLATLPQAG